ncbi:MAG: helix-turn-helix domain-containing protein [Lentisphaerae bacterium]|mgnify:CR=1 FL=1|jgi:DNA-binding IclR family transcriptional regulator|nr:helix-turn-helix domain-containing protein [Lentisphaerota bacterium]MBT5607409.1 helix-turn-helix domain-containing protein [Lentisphaerota bacterium]MBT7056117.1 helix-turn-helix domain-containing protein [Lentisphaerota bacterium]MBT7841355.1 helix-turn-helix domain-containing protein [Lentisphaerota bacterium]
MDKSKTNSPAPAIVHAFKILGFMHDGAEYRIQDIVREVGAPKSSVLRYLETLRSIGAVWRNPVTRAYVSSVRIAAKTDEDPMFDQKRRAAMHELCELTTRTVEWFEAEGDGMVLRERESPPECKISAKVSIGTVLGFEEQLEAVRLLGRAHFAGKGGELVGSQCRRHVGHGVLAPIAPADAYKLVQDAREKKVASDSFCNAHGTRRIAALVEKMGRPVGVMSVIEVVLHQDVLRNLDYLPALQKQAELLSR